MRKNAESLDRTEELGRTLRGIRVKRKWSLKDFERASKGRIKDVVLGSYERGARSISVANLQTIADTYQIPVSAFFGENQELHSNRTEGRVIIDLRKIRESLSTSNSETLTLLNQFTKTIISMRSDWNGEILSLRSSDVAFLSMISTKKDIELKTFYITKD
jgi:transcriptional regulator with XRE-family HTH domain